MMPKIHKNLSEHLITITELQLTLEKQGFELHMSTYIWIIRKCILFSI